MRGRLTAPAHPCLCAAAWVWLFACTALVCAELPPLDWVPPPDRYDWIQLKSGEWLKGRIKAMQDDTLDFDSDELDMLSFDWEDIRQVRTAQPIEVLTKPGPDQKRGAFGLPARGQTFSGQVMITPDQIRVDDGTTSTTFPRNHLQSLTPGGAKEINHWSGDFSLGLTLRGGNSDQADYTGKAHLQRRTPATRLSADYIGNVSRVNSIDSARNHRLNTELDIWLSYRLYLIAPSFEYYYDPLQNLDSRTTTGFGLGYGIIKQSKMEWDVTAGPAYQHARYRSVPPGEPADADSGALTLSTRFDWDITQRIETILEYRGQYTRREIGETTHHTVSTLSIDITKRLDLDLSFIWDRISQPKPAADGTTPEPDDYRLVIGLGLEF